jgi:hypothetical protein
MTTLEFSSIFGLSFPYTVYICDVYGNQCVLVAYISTTVPINNLFSLPPQFDSAPAIGVKVITSDGCEKFKVLYCSDNNKDFMDLQDFFFMDGVPYFFMS